MPPQDGCPDASLTALFTFVARDPLTRKSMAVNLLRPQTPEQQQLFAERQHIADERRAARQQLASGAGTTGILCRLSMSVLDSSRFRVLLAVSVDIGWALKCPQCSRVGHYDFR